MLCNQRFERDLVYNYKHKISFRVLTYMRDIFCEKIYTECFQGICLLDLEYTFQREIFVIWRVTAYDERKSRYSIIDCKRFGLATFSWDGDAVGSALALKRLPAIVSKICI